MTSAFAPLLMVLLLATTSQGVVPAQDHGPLTLEPAEQWVTANAAYESGDYGKATALYEELHTRGHDNGYLSYNLGNAYLKMGRVGNAIVSYHQALSMRPRDADIKANLEQARKTTKDAIAPFEPSPVFQTLFFWHYSLSFNECVWLTWLFNLLFWAALSWRLVDRRDANGWLTALAGLFLAIGVWSIMARIAAPQKLAVVTIPEAKVFSGTTTEGAVRFVLHEGAEIAWSNHDGNWTKIELSDGKQGWVQAEAITVVDTMPAFFSKD